MSQRLNNILFTVLFILVIGMAAWLSTRYERLYDWTANNRNSLSATSIEILAQMPSNIEVTAYARKDEALRQAITRLIARYQRIAPHMSLRFVNPDTAPQQVRDNNITADGQLLLRYDGRSEKLNQIHEQTLSNALLRLSRSHQRRIAFLSGHSERAPQINKQGGIANFDLGLFSNELEQKGLQLTLLNLASWPRVANDTSVLVVANPRNPLLPGEIQIITHYINNGGNLLWLAEPGKPLPASIAQALNTQIQGGTVVDANTQTYGIENPSFALVTEYPASNIVTKGLNSITVFPIASVVDRLDPEAITDWQHFDLLRTLPRSWSENDPIEGEISYNPDSERLGPFAIGMTQTRPHPTGEGEQRIAVIGDADFLSNSYLGNGGNLDLGLALINWLSHDDHLIEIPAKTAPDRKLALTPLLSFVIGFGFLLVIPGLLLGTGGWIWIRRKRR